MERGEVRNYHNQHQQQQQQRGVVCRTTTPSEADFPLQWGSRRRLRCVKIQVKDQATEKTTVRVDRRVVRADKEPNPNLLHRPSPLRVLRNSEAAGGTMKAQNNRHRTSSPEKVGVAEVKGNGVRAEMGQDKKAAGAGSSSGSEAPVWPKFTIGLTNKEKEADFLVIKGTKLPQRPKKRAKFVQRTLNLISPGMWLSDLTIERYEVREKKIAKKKPRGLKAMGNMESDSE